MAPLVVIDTQSLLDWLVFGDPACVDWPRRLGDAWRWVHTPEMKAEFDVVLARGFGPRWPVTAATLATLQDTWASFAHPVPSPPPLAGAARLACSDPDDQKFIDLAISLRAHTLVTRDKALLKLARRAASLHGVRVCTPLAWGGLSDAATPASSGAPSDAAGGRGLTG
jgi:hypothetical protein